MIPISLHLDKLNGLPLYLQLYQQIRQGILTGELRPGMRLPPSRRLAEKHGVARVTITQAYEQLRAEGFIISRQGAGTFVAHNLPLPERGKKAPPFHPHLSDWGRRVLRMGKTKRRTLDSRIEIDFGFGRSFPHIFPYDIWRRLLARYLSTDDVMLSRYGSVAGYYPLRAALADYLVRWRGVHCTPEQVIIVNGAQQALDVLARLWLSAGDEVLVETPGYVDAYQIFQVHGAALTALPVDDDGFPVERIAERCQARLVFVTPSNQFPHGGTMPLVRRLGLLQWAHGCQALVIEDDYDGELRYEGRPLAALQGLDQDGHVVYLGTFSKVLFPALRLSYVVLPFKMVAPFVQAKGLVDRGAPTLTQAAVADFMTEGHFERHLRHLRQAYGRRRQVLVHALERALPGKVRFSHEPAGLHVMLYLDPNESEATFVQRAAAAGVGVYPGSPYHLQASSPPSVLLGFSGLTEEEIIEGVERLATIMI